MSRAAYHIVVRRWLAASAAAATLIGGSWPAAAQQRLPTAADLITFTDVTTVQLAPDGHALLFTTTQRDPAADRVARVVWHLDLVAGAVPQRIGEPPGARSFAWLRDGRLSFLAGERGAAQLYVLDALGAEPRLVASHDDPILRYSFAPDGRSIAFTTLGRDEGFLAEANNARRGVVVSKWDFVFYQLYGNSDFASVQRPVELWLHDITSGRAERISGELSVSDFAWSPGSDAVAIIASPAGGLGVVRSDLLLYTRGRDGLSTLLEGSDSDGFTGGHGYSQPVWSPDGGRIAIQRSGRGDGTRSGPDIAVYDLTTRTVRALTDPATLDLYSPALSWIDDDEIRVEMHYRGQRGLFSIAVRDGALRPLLFEAEMNSGFSFSADGRVAAWVAQSTASPPEVHVSRWPLGEHRRVTSLNERYDSVWLPTAELVHWRSHDGTNVSGLLLKPHGYREGARYPLVTVVHGGPVFAVIDRFQLYSAWEYAGQALAARGYAVFYPNYRGTGSFGPAFRRVSGPEREPVDDILSGIEHLVEMGIADRQRLGIVGQSHGAWVGPMVVIREPTAFRAASFAEGMVDYVTAYMVVPGWHILRSYEPGVGSPFQQTQRYLELSPMYQLGSTRAPTLIEVGQQSLPTQGLRYATTLWRHAIPHELVIYPATGHNITSPALTLDSVERNFDWLDFWILGRIDPDATKADQYRRWQAMQRGEGFPPPLAPDVVNGVNPDW